MCVAYVDELGAADTIRVGDLPVPVPGLTDVLVAVEAGRRDRVVVTAAG